MVNPRQGAALRIGSAIDQSNIGPAGDFDMNWSDKNGWSGNAAGGVGYGQVGLEVSGEYSQNSRKELILLKPTLIEYSILMLSVNSMPKVFEWNGYKFFFFSNEGVPREPCHIHVRKGENIAKFWISTDLTLDSSWGFSPKELAMIEEKIAEQKELIMEKWNEFFQ